MSRAYISLYYSYREQLEILPDDERGRLIIALLDYAENGTIPALDGAAKMAFSFIRSQIDRDSEKYSERCRKNRENISKRWNSGSANTPERVQSYTSVYETYQEKEEGEEKEKRKEKGDGEEKEYRAGILFNEACTRFSPLVVAALSDWLTYKHERNEDYTNTGLQSLLTQVEKQIAGHGGQAVVDAIRLSMSNGWRGIVWDKIREEEARGKNVVSEIEESQQLSGITRL